MNYSYIRIDRGLTVPATSIFSETDDGESVLVYVPGFEQPTRKVGGEVALAVKAFLNGDRKFPITDNHILDIYAGWVNGLAAQRAFNGDDTIAFPLVEVGRTSDWPGLKQPKISQDLEVPSQFFNPAATTKAPVSAVPKINVDKIAKGIRERK